MILNYPLSKENRSLFSLNAEEELYYCVPFDVDADGSFLQNSYVVITTARLIILREGVFTREISLDDFDCLKSEPAIGCGILFFERNQIPEILVRFSSRHLSRFSYLARGTKLLKQGSRVQAVSDEYEKSCPACGRALPGTRECPHCNKKGEGIVHEFLTMLKPYPGQIAVILLLMIGATVVTLLNPEVQKRLIDNILTDRQGPLSKAYVVLFIMFLLSLGIVVINVSKSYLCAKLGSVMSMDLRRKLYAKIQLLTISFINDRRPGELMNRIVFDTRQIKQFMEDTFCNMLTVCILFICDIIFMLVLDVKLALISFAFIPVAVLLSIFFWNNIHRRFHMQRSKDDEVNSNLQDVISGMQVVKSYGKEIDESERFRHVTNQFARIQSKNEVFWAIFFPILSFIMGAGVFLTIYFGGSDVISGTKTPGQLFQFASYTGMLYMYLGWITNLPRQLLSVVTSVERISDVMTQEPRIFDHSDSEAHDIRGEIEFKNASFGYKSYQPVLEHINLHIKPGEMIGLVGASGAGKSTMINLIMHLYEVDDGSLFVDGNDIKQIKLENFHEQIGVVLQETFLFSGTILNNIRFAKPDATYEEIIRAAKMANAHDFILKTTDGYNTYVGERGLNLSGGERQRLAIARAILCNPKMLILDEATASLDTESEYLIQKALQRLTAGKTTFAIAHRLSTLKDADRLVVIDGHSIAEVGTHDELMEKKGLYYGLVTAQLEMMKGNSDCRSYT